MTIESDAELNNIMKGLLELMKNETSDKNIMMVQMKDKL